MCGVRWENTPGYGKYVIDVLDWHTKRAMAIGNLADDYAAQHGRLDAGFEVEVRRGAPTWRTGQPMARWVAPSPANSNP